MVPLRFGFNYDTHQWASPIRPALIRAQQINLVALIFRNPVHCAKLSAM